MNLNPIKWFGRKSTPSKSPASAHRSAAASRPELSPTDLLKKVKDWNELTSPDEMRSAMTELTRLTRSYAAGVVTQYNADFVGTYGNANTEILPDKYAVRARARTLGKDTPQGKAIRRTFQDNVAGPQPFKLDMRYGARKEVEVPQQLDVNGQPIPHPSGKKSINKFVSDEDTNNAIEAFWRWFIKPENFSVDKSWGFNEACWMTVGEQVESGGVLCREYKDYPYSEIKYAVRFLEEDRLQEMYSGIYDGNPIRGSKEFDATYGFVIAYWILTRHPGEFLAQPTWGDPAARTFRERVPADQIMHIMNMRDRAEQEFGMTEFDAASNAIWRNHQFNTALTLCAIASHIRAFVLEKKFPTGIELPTELKAEFSNWMANYGAGLAGPQGQDGGGDLNNPIAQQQAIGTRTNTLKPAQERELPYGVEAKILAPQFPTEQAHEFRLDNHREVGLAAGISYQHASGDFQNLGFIAGLMCQIPFQLRCKIRQQHLKDNWLARLFRNALKAAIVHGWFDRRGYDFISITKLDDYCDAANFKGMRWPFVNPLIQAQTLILLMEAGMLSPQQVQDEMPDGVSIEDLYTMYAEAKAEAAQHGLDFSSSDPTRPNIQKGVPGETTPNPEEGGGAAAPSKTKTSNPVRTFPNRMRVDINELLRMSQNGDH